MRTAAITAMRNDARSWIVIALYLVTLQVCAQQTSLPDRPPPGHTRRISLPQTPIAPKIDGNLDDAAWAHAAHASEFWNSLQERWPAEQTEVLVMADRTNLYFGFKVHDREPGRIEALQTRRDGDLGLDDQIGVMLDPLLNYRDIATYRVNAIGTQRDDLAAGRARQLAWKGDWKAAVARTDYGWSVEIAIPFSILNFEPGIRVIGVNFTRFHHRTGESSNWADTTVRSLPEEMGQLTDVRTAVIGKETPWTFLPYVIAGHNLPNRSGEVKRGVVDGGIDIRYEPRPNLTGVLSVRPDFTQVERSITDIDFSYTEKYRSDPRPFFQEGASYYGTNRTYFYSNRIPTFDYGVKAFGNVGAEKFGVLAVRSPDDRSDAVVNLDHRFDPTHYASATLVATDRAALNNQLYAASGRGRESSGFEYGVDAAGTRTDASGAVTTGAFGRGTVGWSSGYWSIGASADRFSRFYDPRNGLLASDLPDTSGGSAFVSYYRDRAEGFLRELRADASLEQRDTGAGDLQRRRAYVAGSAELREQQVRIGTSYYGGPYRPNAGSPGAWATTLNHDRYWNVSLDFNTRNSRFAYGLANSHGRLGGDDYNYLTAYVWVRPTNTTSLNVTSERLQNFGSYRQTTLSGGWDITPRQSLLFRVIDAYYGNAYRAAYAWHARTNVDLFVVFDTFPGQPNQVSAKILMTL